MPALACHCSIGGSCEEGEESTGWLFLGFGSPKRRKGRRNNADGDALSGDTSAPSGTNRPHGAYLCGTGQSSSMTSN